MIDVVCYYHEPQKVPLLRAAVLPAIAEVEARSCAAHVERHWLHGPHLRVRIAGEQETAAADMVAGRLRSYLRSHPSRSTVDADVLLGEARRAGEAELVTGPYTPIHPDNSVRVEPTDHSRLVALLGSPQVAGRDVLLRLGLGPIATTAAHLDGGNTVAARVRVAVAAMAVHAANYPHGIGVGQHSFFSHLKDFLFFDDHDGAILRAYEGTWPTARATVVDLVRDIAAGGSASPDIAAVVDSWRTWTSAASAHVDATMDTAVLTTAANHQRTAATFGGATELRWDHRRRAYSDYHTMLNTIGFEEVALSRVFGVYRFCTNMLYQLLLVCDLSSIERYLAAYLFTTAVAEIDGRTWQDRLRAFAAARARRVAAS